MILANYFLSSGDGARPVTRLVTGVDTLVPSGVGGFVEILFAGLTGQQFTENSFFIASYTTNAFFIPANAGFLLPYWDSATQTLTVYSSNVADNNTIRWLAIQ